MVMTYKKHSDPDVWLETLNKDTDTLNMILIIWSKEAMKYGYSYPKQ